MGWSHEQVRYTTLGCLVVTEALYSFPLTPIFQQNSICSAKECSCYGVYFFGPHYCNFQAYLLGVFQSLGFQITPPLLFKNPTFCCRQFSQNTPLFNIQKKGNGQCLSQSMDSTCLVRIQDQQLSLRQDKGKSHAIKLSPCSQTFTKFSHLLQGAGIECRMFGIQVAAQTLFNEGEH